jgi:hypothetical protein
MFKMKYLEEEKRLMVEGLQQEHQATLSDLKAQVCMSVCLPLLLLVYSIVKSKRQTRQCQNITLFPFFPSLFSSLLP